MELINFADRGECARWHSVNDAVMGGVSHSRMLATGHGCLFQGQVSLANGGGFASMRRALSLPGDCRALALRLRGDGKRYQLRLKMDGAVDGVVYVAPFETGGKRWQVLALSLCRFRPRYRGRAVTGADPIDPGRVAQIGLLVGEGQQGPFELELAGLSAVLPR
ncbi:CIA30 family protein [Ferrimonas sediminicola]|uniref:CIA30 family protein n=1 Tax=Ferrimonas sediminicola TaxID=2569538 RepID=A0A4U1BGY9_9GAMM|nr:CIA30 family protein [Ferrimonas sediminicola]TKB50287.1 CIA30 family protein [Ferrimonas sediminicola]